MFLAGVVWVEIQCFRDKCEQDSKELCMNRRVHV